MARFCPHCGKPDTVAEFHGELCVECARERLPPLPSVRVAVCPKCGAVIDKANKRKDASVGEEAARLLKLKSSKPVFAAGYASVEYESRYGRVVRPLTLIMDRRLCADCARSHSQYFEAIIQLRGEGKKVGRTADRLLLLLQKRTFVPRMEELKEGVDIYCGSRSEAIAALNSLGMGFLRTEKLAVQRDVRRLYRTTLLVRL